jgi:hypothetical protein
MWIQLFKYLSFIDTMSKLFGTIIRVKAMFFTFETTSFFSRSASFYFKSAKDIGGFGIIFLIVFFAFVQLGYLLFGNQVVGTSTTGYAICFICRLFVHLCLNLYFCQVLAFSSISRSIFTLLAFMLGHFNYMEVEDANRLLGPIFFIAYMVFVFMILTNMFLGKNTIIKTVNILRDFFPLVYIHFDLISLAIINTSYHAIKEESDTPQSHIQEIKEARSWWCSSTCCRRKSATSTYTPTDIVIDPSEIKSQLQRFRQIISLPFSISLTGLTKLVKTSLQHL